jgi:hypothetical protein
MMVRAFQHSNAETSNLGKQQRLRRVQPGNECLPCPVSRRFEASTGTATFPPSTFRGPESFHLFSVWPVADDDSPLPIYLAFTCKIVTRFSVRDRQNMLTVLYTVA